MTRNPHGSEATAPRGHEDVLVWFERVYDEQGCQEGDVLQGRVAPEARYVGGLDVRLQKCVAEVLWAFSYTNGEESLALGYADRAGYVMKEGGVPDKSKPLTSITNFRVLHTLAFTDWEQGTNTTSHPCRGI